MPSAPLQSPGAHGSPVKGLHQPECRHARARTPQGHGLNTEQVRGAAGCGSCMGAGTKWSWQPSMAGWLNAQCRVRAVLGKPSMGDQQHSSVPAASKGTAQPSAHRAPAQPWGRAPAALRAAATGRGGKHKCVNEVVGERAAAAAAPPPGRRHSHCGSAAEAARLQSTAQCLGRRPGKEMSQEQGGRRRAAQGRPQCPNRLSWSYGNYRISNIKHQQLDDNRTHSKGSHFRQPKLSDHVRL